MKIAILGWGSLIWNPGNLETLGEWQNDGPSLPIEFSRISENGRLTLVIDTRATDVKTLYITSAFQEIEAAILNLAAREQTENLENIGFINFIANTQRVLDANLTIINKLTDWNKSREFDAIIWSDFSRNFQLRTGNILTVAHAIQHIEQLATENKRAAVEYIRNAPVQIQTRLRKDLEAQLPGNIYLRYFCK